MDDAQGDVLSDGTAARVAAAVRWWEAHPDARLIMQGTSGRIDLGDEHQAELMRRFAMSYGVPYDQILLEGRSRNTREHVECVLAFPEISSATPIGVVTSDWHMRRTAMEFRNAFDNVAVHTTRPRPVEGRHRQHYVPRERDLHASSAYIREWMAIVYYRLTRE
jgi:uncharacterized SAM-binding protein YcdF (DUF218 family)